MYNRRTVVYHCRTTRYVLFKILSYFVCVSWIDFIFSFQIWRFALIRLWIIKKYIRGSSYVWFRSVANHFPKDIGWYFDKYGISISKKRNDLNFLFNYCIVSLWTWSFQKYVKCNVNFIKLRFPKKATKINIFLTNYEYLMC